MAEVDQPSIIHGLKHFGEKMKPRASHMGAALSDQRAIAKAYIAVYLEPYL
jgi:hypothetical protein